MGPVSVGAAALSGSVDHGSIASGFALGGAGGGHSISTLGIALSVGMLIATLLAASWLLLAQHGGRRGNDDDGNPGSEGSGWRRPPNGPPGPRPEPEWWGDFERQFASYVQSQSGRADVRAAHGKRADSSGAGSSRG